MSRFFPQAEFAEDQPLSKTILTTHVLYRGFQSGAMLGSVAGAVRSIAFQRPTIRASLSHAQQDAQSVNGMTASQMRPAQIMSVSSRATARVLASAGTGSAVGTALMAIALVGRMRGRDQIEWNDRSWRLLNNPSQVEVDDWSVAGAVGGVIGSRLVRSTQTITPWKRLAGGAGIGSLAGVAGYMIWRYGVHRGER